MYVSLCSPAKVFHSISMAESQPCAGVCGMLGLAKDRQIAPRQMSFQRSNFVFLLTRIRISRLRELMRTVSTGGFMACKVSFFDMGFPRLIVVRKKVMACDGGLERFVVSSDDFFVG